MCDQVLLLVPLVAVVACVVAAPRPAGRLWLAACVFAACNVAAILMMVAKSPQEAYVWFAPVIVACAAWSYPVGRSPEVPARVPVSAGA